MMHTRLGRGSPPLLAALATAGSAAAPPLAAEAATKACRRGKRGSSTAGQKHDLYILCTADRRSAGAGDREETR